MEFSIEKFISNFVESQFPQFYQEEGPNFILFTKAYYEWLESSENPISESRNLLDYRDIDNTLEKFLLFFQQKYLYGIPFNVIINKRLLLKHIFDVYRSKGSINCYKLLFKMIYNEDVEIYLPSIDILRVSDGTWLQPRFIEVSNFEVISEFVGKTLIGLNSGTVATAENILRENYNNNQITTIYISNINPKGGLFEIGEKVVPIEKKEDFEFISRCPNVLGSIAELDILGGGRDYKINDIVKIIQTDPITNEPATKGRESYLKILGLREGLGELRFDLVDGGYGFSQDSSIFIYRNGTSGEGASFSLGPLVNVTQTPVSYNTDIVGDYLDKSLSALTFEFPKFPSSNLNSTIQDSLSYSSKYFGSLGSLINVNPGKDYINPANVFVRSVTLSKPIAANVSYSDTSPVVTFTSLEQIGTYANILLNASAYNFPRNPTANVSASLETTISILDFYNLLAPNEVISLQSVASNNQTRELHVVKEIANLTSLILYGEPTFSSTSTSQVRIGSVIFPANFVTTDPLMDSPNEFVNGLNEKIRAFASIGRNVANRAVALSGKGFYENELVTAGLYGTVNSNIEIINGGSGYTNNELLIFASPQFNRNANGFILTNNSGNIVDVIVTDVGSGYVNPPEVRVQSKNGTGASFSCTVDDFNYTTAISGRVIKSGNGKELGYYSTTRGFLNSDKYIQDSYYYQDYSYEIRVSRSLNKYKSILYETFHNAGTELFGKFSFVKELGADSEILYENNAATIT